MPKPVTFFSEEVPFQGGPKSTFVQGDRTLRLFGDPRPDSSVQKTTCFWQ